VRKEHEGVLARLRPAGKAETAAWHKLKGEVDWEKYRASPLTAMRGSLGRYPKPPADLKERVHGTIEGDG
jgi:hypothetical protein